VNGGELIEMKMDAEPGGIQQEGGKRRETAGTVSWLQNVEKYVADWTGGEVQGGERDRQCRKSGVEGRQQSLDTGKRRNVRKDSAESARGLNFSGGQWNVRRGGFLTEMQGVIKRIHETPRLC